MRLLTRPVLLALLLFILFVLPLGLIEGWYGRVDYSGDAIPYLDMARAIHNGEWKLAFNPLWGLGYVLLIAFAKTFFALTPAGEWNAIHLLNLLVYSGCFAGLMFLLRSIRLFLNDQAGTAETIADGRIVLAGTFLFLSAELCLDTVSRVGPDTLVTTLMLLALGLLLRLLQKPAWSTASLLGVVLGFGYVVKTIFLPLSLVIVVVAAVALYRRDVRRTSQQHSALSLLAGTIGLAAVFAAPYAAGLSWSLGRFTLGESGTLNYAWHVNRLELMHWQGGPAQFGKPLHPTHLLLADPPVYGFSQPFNVSYPPFFNPPYYYEGYKHFFSMKLQVHAIAANLLHLYQALRPLPITYAVMVCLVVILLTSSRDSAATGRQELLRLWPILVPAAAGIALYLQVHLEARYLPAFLLVLSAAPMAIFLQRCERRPAYAATLVLTILAVGSVATLIKIDGSTIDAARHHTRYSDSSQWVLARYLQQHGLRPGDDVAVIAGPANHCTWAHVDGLHIVAELEGSLYAPMNTRENLFWDATPATRQKIMEAFKQSGAKVVIARITAPKQLATPGWTAIPGTDNMIHTLDQ